MFIKKNKPVLMVEKFEPMHPASKQLFSKTAILGNLRSFSPG